MAANEETEYVRVSAAQLAELKKQLKESKEALQQQGITIRKALNVLSFIKNMVPMDDQGNPDLDPMALMSMITDKAKFKPIMQDLADLQKYAETYEQTTVRILSNGN